MPGVDLVAERFDFRGKPFGQLMLAASRQAGAQGPEWRVEKLALDQQRRVAAGLGRLARYGRRRDRERARVPDRSERRRQLPRARRLRQRRQGRQGDARGHARLARRALEPRLPQPRRRAEARGDRRPVPRDRSRLRQAALADEPAAAAAAHRPRLHATCSPRASSSSASTPRRASTQGVDGAEGLPHARLGRATSRCAARWTWRSETQNLRVRIIPGVGDTAGTALVFVNPAVGVARGDRAARAEEPARTDLRLPVLGHRQLERPEGGAGSARRVPSSRRRPSRRDADGGGADGVGARRAGEPRGGGPADRRRGGGGREAWSRCPENFYIIGRDERDKVRAQGARRRRARSRIFWLQRQARMASGLSAAPPPSPVTMRAASAAPAWCSTTPAGASHATTRCTCSASTSGAENATTRREPSSAGNARGGARQPVRPARLSICYDVRFPELYRGLGEVDVIFVPSAFTVPTGARALGDAAARARDREPGLRRRAGAGRHARQRPAHLRPYA